MKKVYFGSNLKMYKTAEETAAYLKELSKLTKDISREEVELFIIPSYIALGHAVAAVDKKNIRIGAQNMFWEDKGQFTGEVSPIMLEDMNVKLVMIGHSERRHVFGETDDEENKKVSAAMRHNFTALLCVGETGVQKEIEISREVIRSQLKIGLHGVDVSDAGRIWIAYEPVWSIGVNGTPASAEYAEEIHKVIKECLNEIFGEASEIIPVLYGGSVNPSNACKLIQQPSIDGLFVGRAAWEAEKFDALIRSALESIK